MTRTIEAAEIRARQVADEVAALSRSGIAEIEASLDRVASKATSLASLPVTLERAEQLLVDVERSKSDVQALAQQIQIARETLSREIISASEQIDVIGSKAATVTTRKGRAGSGDTSVAETIARQRELQGVLLTTMRSAESAEQLGRLRLAELREVEGMLTRVQHASRALRIQVMDLEGRVRGAGEQFGEAA
jgi:predicted  nucleic acid-binding Zn-ribbon protein